MVDKIGSNNQTGEQAVKRSNEEKEEGENTLDFSFNKDASLNNINK
ncbi:MAG: hypothetical protein ACKO96_17210 [Flammeovirgaceae bacterium]